MLTVKKATDEWAKRITEIETLTGPLLAEADYLRRAIAAVEGIEPEALVKTTRPNTPTTKPKSRARRRGAPASSRPAHGENRKLVLDAIRTDAKTVGEITKATGLNRGTVSTTVARLVKNGEAEKAHRGYRARQRERTG